jgi:hypothetical protein
VARQSDGRATALPDQSLKTALGVMPQHAGDRDRPIKHHKSSEEGGQDRYQCEAQHRERTGQADRDDRDNQPRIRGPRRLGMSVAAAWA